MTGRAETTEQYIARQVGDECWSCATPNEDCLRRILVESKGACCGACAGTDTHRTGEVEAKARKRAELLSAADAEAIAAKVSGSQIEALYDLYSARVDQLDKQYPHTPMARNAYHQAISEINGMGLMLAKLGFTAEQIAIEGER